MSFMCAKWGMGGYSTESRSRFVLLKSSPKAQEFRKHWKAESVWDVWGIAGAQCKGLWGSRYRRRGRVTDPGTDCTEVFTSLGNFCFLPWIEKRFPSRRATRYGAGSGVQSLNGNQEGNRCWGTANNVHNTLSFPTVSDRKKIKQSMFLKAGMCNSQMCNIHTYAERKFYIFVDRVNKVKRKRLKNHWSAMIRINFFKIGVIFWSSDYSGVFCLVSFVQCLKE